MRRLGTTYYEFANKLVNGFIRNGHMVVHLYDRDMARQGALFNSRVWGVGRANTLLVKKVSDLQPHIIVFQHADVIQLETLLQLRKKFPAMHMVQVNIDALFTPQNVSRIAGKAHVMDATFLTTGGDNIEALTKGRTFFIPNIVDSSVEAYTSFASPHHAYDVFFAQSNPDGENDMREIASRRIIAELGDLRTSIHSLARKNMLWGHNYMQHIANSKITLNLSRKSFEGGPVNTDLIHMYSSDRISHLVGNGTLVFSERCFRLDRLFNENEMVFFETVDELISKIQFYTRNDTDWRKIAEAAYIRAHRDYNGCNVARYITDIAMHGTPTQSYPWPQI